MFGYHLKLIWRRLVKDRRFTLLNLIGLCTGLASAILIYLWVNDEINVDGFHGNNHRLYKAMYNIQTSNAVLTIPHTPYPLAGTLVAEMPEVESVVSVNSFFDWFAGPGMVLNDKSGIKTKAIFASRDFFNVFSFRLVLGDSKSVLNDKSSVAISESLANKLYGSIENSIGKPLVWEHKMRLPGPFHISGIFRDVPKNSSQQFDLIFNFDLLLEAEKNAGDWKGTYAETFIVLKEGADPKVFENKIKNISKQKDPANEKCSVFIQKYSRQYLHGNFVNGIESGGRIQYVRLFSIIAVFILLIACINFMNLSTAQATTKLKEVGVKKVVGASRKSLILQFISESVSLAMVSLAGAMVLVNLLIPYFNNITGKDLAVVFNFNFIITSVCISVITGIIAGSYPAFYLSKFKPVSVLKGKIQTSSGELNIRKALVIIQFTISVIFIVGIITVHQQIKFIHEKNLGYSRTNIIQFTREGEMKGDPEIFLDQLKAIPGVENASCMAGTILSGIDGQSGYSWRGQKSDETYMFNSPRINYGFIETLGIELIAGRTFSKQFNDDDSKIILNESAWKMMGIEDPIGKTIKAGTENKQIIGIVGDFQYGSLHKKIEPLIFRFRNAFVSKNIFVRIKPGTEKATLAQIESQYKETKSSYPFEYSFLDEEYNQLYDSEQRIAGLSNYFAALAIIISCLGLFGLVAFTAQRRQKEMSIRKIVGATTMSVMIMLCRDFMKLVFVSVLIAIPLSWWFMNRWLENFAYKVNIGGLIFLTAGSAILLIALLTIGLQAFRAAMQNPVKHLRSE